MIYPRQGEEKEAFVSFVEYALGFLARQEYADFLRQFEISRMTEKDLIFALRYLDDRRPVLKIDDPAAVKGSRSEGDLYTFRDNSGYHLDYDLTTGGRANDLTIQVDFLRKDGGYTAVLEDLHTL